MAAKKKSRKTEPCEFCGGKHYSEEARYRCFNKNQAKDKCECPRYWRRRWLSHCRDCPLYGEKREAVEEGEVDER